MFLKGHKNDYRDREAIAEAVQRPTMRFVPFKSAEQLDFQALHRVRSRLVGQRTAVMNQIRAFLLEHRVAVRQGPGALRQALPSILAQRTDVLLLRIIRLIEGLIDDWRRFDQRIADVTTEIEQLAHIDILGSEIVRREAFALQHPADVGKRVEVWCRKAS